MHCESKMRFQNLNGDRASEGRRAIKRIASIARRCENVLLIIEYNILYTEGVKYVPRSCIQGVIHFASAKKVGRKIDYTF